MSLTEKARFLRKNMTREEVKLWVQLQHLNKRGFRFRRQAPADGFILDFAEFNCRLIIEVDGAQHGDGAGQQSKDTRRDEHFAGKGFSTLRFWNHQINREMDGVMDQIISVLPAAPPALRATSP